MLITVLEVWKSCHFGVNMPFYETVKLDIKITSLEDEVTYLLTLQNIIFSIVFFFLLFFISLERVQKVSLSLFLGFKLDLNDSSSDMLHSDPTRMKMIMELN